MAEAVQKRVLAFINTRREPRSVHAFRFWSFARLGWLAVPFPESFERVGKDG